MIKVQINNICAKLVECEPLTSGMIGKTLDVEMSAEWQNYTKTAVFSNGDTVIDVIESQWDGNTITIPAEVLSIAGRTVIFGMYGFAVENGTTFALPTIYAKIGIPMVGTDPESDPTTDPSLPVYAQLQWQIDHFEVSPEQIAEQVQEYLDEHPIEIPAASATVLGGVKIGEGLSVTTDGTLSTDVTADDLDDLADIVDEKLSDAPSDGKQYARKDGAWSEVESGGYEPPAGGIPQTDLASDVQASLGKADTSVQPDALDDYAKKSDLPINVKDFGAKGDGETDDTDAIQNAIDYATDLWEEKQNIRTVYFPSGNYLISKPLVVKVSQKPYWDAGNTGGIQNIPSVNARIGIRLMGEFLGTTVIKKTTNATATIYTSNTDDGTASTTTVDAVIACGYTQYNSTTVRGGMGVYIDNLALRNWSPSSNTYVVYSVAFNTVINSCNLVGNRSVSTSYGLWLHSYYCSIKDVIIDCNQKGFWQEFGTSTVIERVLVGKCTNPFHVVSNYTTLISCGGDHCKGIMYELGGAITMVSCGGESPLLDTFISICEDASAITATATAMFRLTNSDSITGEVINRSSASLIAVPSDNCVLMLIGTQISGGESGNIVLNWLNVTGSNLKATIADYTYVYPQLYSAPVERPIGTGNGYVHYSLASLGKSYHFDGTLDIYEQMRDNVLATQCEFFTQPSGYYETVPDFTNVTAQGTLTGVTNSGGLALSENGLVGGTYSYSTGNPLSIASSPAYLATGLIPIADAVGKKIRVKGATFSGQTSGQGWACSWVAVNSSKNYLGRLSKAWVFGDTADTAAIEAWQFQINLDEKYMEFVVPSTYDGKDFSNAAYFCFTLLPIGEMPTDIIVTIDEEIAYKQVWVGTPRTMTDDVKVKWENVINTGNVQPTTIIDTAGYFTTDTVEGALAEIGAKLAAYPSDVWEGGSYGS